MISCLLSAMRRISPLTIIKTTSKHLINEIHKHKRNYAGVFIAIIKVIKSENPAKVMLSVPKQQEMLLLSD